MDLWDPTEPEDFQGERRAEEEPDKSWATLQPLAALNQRLFPILVPPCWTFKRDLCLPPQF